MTSDLQDLLHAFRNSRSGRRTDSPITLSRLVSDVYSGVMAHFDEDPNARSYRTIYGTKKPHPDQITSAADVAGDLWYWFPTHFFKFHNMLVEMVLPGSARDLAQSVFGCGRLTVLDIGAGVGTAALACIDLLYDWQRFLIQSGHAPSRIELTVQSVEVNRRKLPVLDHILRKAADLVPPALMRIRVRQPITCPFPDEACVAGILEALKGGGPQLLVTLSNILTWIRDWRPSGERGFKRLWARVIQFFKPPQPPPYLLATVDLANRLPFDIKTVALVETDDADGRLSRSVAEATKAMGAALEGVAAAKADAGSTVFVNPPASVWSQRGRQISPAVPFHRGLCRALPADFRHQQGLHAALEGNTLFLAWAKTRHWAHSMFIGDEVATKLFEVDLAWNLERFRQMAYAGIVHDVHTDATVPYQSPKSADANRPMSCCALEEQMLLVAFLWVRVADFEKEFGRFGRASFGYTLNTKGDEFLYEHWFICHRRFERAIRQALTRAAGHFYQGDIKKFFDSLVQAKLEERLLALIDKREKVIRRVWQRHLARRCWNGTGDGKGIPQGHAISGFLSNVYLEPFDREMYVQHDLRGRYFRYVDDMFWIYEQGQCPDRLPEMIGASLVANHSLALNEEKSRTGTRDDYLRRTTDQELQRLADRCHAAIRPVYGLAHREASAFRQNRHAFCLLYAQLMEQVGVFVSPWYLLRKLRMANTVGASLQAMLARRQRFTFPPLPKEADAATMGTWVQRFREKNLRWCARRSELADSLLAFCGGALTVLDTATNADQRKGLLRRVRFAAFRLSVFYHPDAVTVFGTLLSKPWIVHPHVTAKALRHYRALDLLLGGLNSSFSLVRAKCAQELGHLLDERAKTALWSMAELAESLCENGSSGITEPLGAFGLGGHQAA